MSDPNTGTTDKTRAGIGADAGQLADKAKKFAKDRPYTAAALAGVVGLAILNTLRGKGRSA